MLRPGGLFLFNVWDRIEANDFSRIVNDTVATMFPGDPPTFLSRTVHGYHDADGIRDQFGSTVVEGRIRACVISASKAS